MNGLAEKKGGRKEKWFLKTSRGLERAAPDERAGRGHALARKTLARRERIGPAGPAWSPAAAQLITI